MLTTNFPLEISNYIKSIKIEGDDWLNSEQRIIHNIYINVLKRGMLAYFLPGTGKTHLGAACAMSINKPVLYITNKSLIADFNAKIEKIKQQLIDRGIDPQKLREFRFLSLNASNLKKQLDNVTFNGSLDNTFIIIDEAHHFFNSVINGSINASDLYLRIKNAKNVRVLFLTGTPIMKDPFAIVPCVNMLAGFELLPENPEDFEKLYFDEHGLKNVSKLENRLIGLIAYYELPKEEAKIRLPKELPEVIIQVEMSDYQYTKYVLERDHEIEEVNRSKQIAQSIGKSQVKENTSTYRIASRKACNIVPPKHCMKDKKFDPSLLTDEECKNIKQYSPKLDKLIQNILKHSDRVQYVYSILKDYGIFTVARLLEYHKYLNYETHGPGEKRFAMIHGDIPIEERSKRVSLYNEDYKGSKIAILLITVTGSEGFDFLCSSACHILEYFFHEAIIEQITKRGNRLDSHLKMPENERTFVTYKYFSLVPKDRQKEDNPENISTDLHLYNMAQERSRRINLILNLMKRVSLHCLNNCKVCSPTDKPLYRLNYKDDMDYPDPCKEPSRSDKVKVNEFIYNGEKYYYDSQLRIIKFDKKINEYVYLNLNDPIYYLLYAEVEKLVSK